MNIKDFFSRLLSPQPDRPENTGVILGNADTDYFVGVNSPIEYKVRLQDGDWTKYCWPKNLQWCIKDGKYVDQMACVTHSVLTAIETQEFFLTGKQNKYSRRWIAKLSGTTAQGNSLYKVADTIRKYGLVLEEDYSTPTSYTFDEFYQEIPNLEALTAKGLAWLQKWNFQYEFLQNTDQDIDKHLKHCPLQVVIPGHAVCGFYSPSDLTTYRDTYNTPWDKTYQSSLFLAVMKPILTPKTIMAREIGWQGSPELGLYLPFDSMQRRDKFRTNLSQFDPEYSVDISKTYILPTKKPLWN